MYFSEPMPNCVPEYYRERQEAREHEEALRARNRPRCDANRAKLDAAMAAGLPVSPYGGYPACRQCPKADYETECGEDDDMCMVICTDPRCLQHHRLLRTVTGFCLRR